MSYFHFQQYCSDCKKTWTAAFGIVGNTQIAAPPIKCPECGSVNIASMNTVDFPVQQTFVAGDSVKEKP